MSITVEQLTSWYDDREKLEFKFMVIITFRVSGVKEENAKMKGGWRLAGNQIS